MGFPWCLFYPWFTARTKSVFVSPFVKLFAAISSDLLCTHVAVRPAHSETRLAWRLLAWRLEYRVTDVRNLVQADFILWRINDMSFFLTNYLAEKKNCSRQFRSTFQRLESVAFFNTPTAERISGVFRKWPLCDEGKRSPFQDIFILTIKPWLWEFLLVMSTVWDYLQGNFYGRTLHIFCER